MDKELIGCTQDFLAIISKPATISNAPSITRKLMVSLSNRIVNNVAKRSEDF
jgi:hypothetical protein